MCANSNYILNSLYQLVGSIFKPKHAYTVICTHTQIHIHTHTHTCLQWLTHTHTHIYVDTHIHAL